MNYLIFIKHNYSLICDHIPIVKVKQYRNQRNIKTIL